MKKPSHCDIGGRQFALNITSNIVSLTLNTVLGIFMVPYIIRHLGVAGYGLYPLLMTYYMGFMLVVSAFNSTVSRFLLVNLEEGQLSKAKALFSASCFAAGGVCLFVSPVLATLAWFSPKFFNFEGSPQDVRLLFFFGLFSSLAMVLEGLFGSFAFAKNRLDLRNLAVIISRLVFILVVVGYFNLGGASVWQLGLGMMLGAVASLATSIIQWRILTPEIVLDLKSTNYTSILPLLGMCGWIVLNNIGSVLFLQVEMTVVNIFFGATDSGRYGSVLQLSSFVRSIAGSVAVVFTPAVVAYFAVGNLKYITSLQKRAVRIMGLCLALPIGILMGLARQFLSIWLGPSFGDISSLFVVMLFHLPINLAVLPLFAIQTALNRVRVPGLVTLGLGLLNVTLSVAAASSNALGLMGVALAGALVLTLKNLFFTPLYSARIQKVPWWTFFLPVCRSLTSTIFVTVMAYTMGKFVCIDSWPRLLMASACIASVYVPFIFFIDLNDLERKELSQKAFQYLKLGSYRIKG